LDTQPNLYLAASNYHNNHKSDCSTRLRGVGWKTLNEHLSTSEVVSPHTKSKATNEEE